MKHNLLFLTIFSILLVYGFSSCSKNENRPGDGTAKLQFVLTDAPAAYDAVLIDIQKVEFNTTTGDSNWQEYPITPKVYDLLQLRNGGTVTMGEPLSLPAGTIEQIRLVLGNNNSVVVNGQSFALTTPSAQQSGLKINFHKELASDGVYKIWLDFDAARSIVSAGNSGKYILKPVIKAFVEETSGQLKGFVLPPQALAIVYAMKGNDSVGSAIPAPDGYFKFVGLSDGVYSLSFNANDTTGYKDTIINNLNVVFGKVTDAGITTLHK